MKKYLLCIVVTVVCTLFAKVSLAQHYYVRVRPSATVIVRPVAPSRRHIWVESEWRWRGGAYVMVPGYWALPPRPGVLWVPGHWRNYGPRGYEWIPGRWR